MLTLDEFLGLVNLLLQKLGVDGAFVDIEQGHVVVGHFMKLDDELDQICIRLLPERIFALPEEVVQKRGYVIGECVAEVTSNLLYCFLIISHDRRRILQFNVTRHPSRNARDQGDVAASRSLFEENLVLWKELGDRVAIARSLSNLANVVKLQGEYAMARSMYGECYSIFQELGDRTGAAWSLNYEGDVARDQGDAGVARTLYQEGLSIFRELGDRWGVAGSLADLGNLSRDQKDDSTSQSLYRESMSIFQELGHKPGIARLLECFACSAAAQLKPERSLRLAGASAALRRMLGTPLPPAEQAKLERSLEPARQSLTNTAASAAWLEGWVMPVEKAVQFAIGSDGD